MPAEDAKGETVLEPVLAEAGAVPEDYAPDAAGAPEDYAPETCETAERVAAGPEPEGGAGEPPGLRDALVEGVPAGKEEAGPVVPAGEPVFPEAAPAADQATTGVAGPPETVTGATERAPSVQSRDEAAGSPAKTASDGGIVLLEEGYEAMAAGQTGQALAGFRRALDRGLPPALAILVAANAASLYRQLGDYREAVRILRRVRLCYGARLSPAEAKRLEAQITYLETLRWLLEREGLAGLPVDRIPPVLKERAARAAHLMR